MVARGSQHGGITTGRSRRPPDKAGLRPMSGCQSVHRSDIHEFARQEADTRPPEQLHAP